MTSKNSWLEWLISQKHDLAHQIVERQYELQPEFLRYGDHGRKLALEDAGYHLDYLFTSLVHKSPALFHAYLNWAESLFHHLSLPKGSLRCFYTAATDVLSRHVQAGNLSTDQFHQLTGAIDRGFDIAHTKSLNPVSSIRTDNPLKEELEAFTRFLVESDRHSAAHLVQDLLKKGTDPKEIYRHLFHPFQIELGNLWQQNKITVAQEHFATASTQFIMSLLYEKILTTPKGNRVLLGTCVSGELHEMGIRMVCDYLECCGWNTYFLGSNMPTRGILDMVVDKNPDIIAISCTMTYHIPKVVSLIEQLRKEDIKNSVLVGGYPFNLDPELWKKTGADGYANDFDTIHETAELLAGGDSEL